MKGFELGLTLKKSCRKFGNGPLPLLEMADISSNCTSFDKNYFSFSLSIFFLFQKDKEMG